MGSSDGKTAAPEREQTDESLRTERANTDRALAERQAIAQEDADIIVQRARENADAVLGEAREKADDLLAEAAEGNGPQSAIATVAAERVVEDALLREERASADESLKQERDENARVLARLLPLERDKTDRFLLTERVRSDDAVSVRDDFLGIVSHDLRNLLGGIVMSASLLADTVADSETKEGKESLLATSRIQRYAARMNRLIGDLVDVASIDAGKLAVAAQPGDANALIGEGVDTFHAAASAKGISLEAQVASGPLMGSFDHDRLFQVLANLVTNAIKFSGEGGTITLRAERAPDGLQFAIRDTGSGIPPSMLTSVFERFWQVGKNDRRGVGLGLYISKCIVEAHGGTIWAESTMGVGSTFFFTVPDEGRRPSLRPSAPPSAR